MSTLRDDRQGDNFQSNFQQNNFNNNQQQYQSAFPSARKSPDRNLQDSQVNIQDIQIKDYMLIEEINDDNYDFAWDSSKENQNKLLSKKYYNSYKARNKNGEIVEIWQIKASLLNNIEACFQELQEQKQSTNPYWSKIIDVIDLSTNKFTNPRIYIVKEYEQNTLYNYLLTKNEGYLSEYEAYRIFSHLILGIKHLIQEQQQVLLQHQAQQRQVDYIKYDSLLDLNPENIFIKEQDGLLHAKIGSFLGLQTQLKSFVHEHLPGKLVYSSPQIILRRVGFDEVTYTEKADVWSLGVLLYQMLCGKLPWNARDEKSYLKLLHRQRLMFPFEKKLGQNTIELLKGCLQFDEEDRWSFDDILKSAYFQYKEGPLVDSHIKEYNLNAQTRDILQNLQIILELRELEISQYISTFDTNSDQLLSLKEFYYMISAIDPRITLYEIEQVFHNLSFQGPENKKYIRLDKFVNLLSYYDFKNTKEKETQILQDVRNLINSQEINLKNIFDSDGVRGYMNKSQYKYEQQSAINVSNYIQKSQFIKKQQFEEFIRFLAPGLTHKEVDILFDSIDENKNNKVEREELKQLLIYGSQDDYLMKEKIQKLLYNMQFIKFDPTQQNNLDQYKANNFKELENLFKEYDSNQNGFLEYQEFFLLMNDLNQDLPVTEIQHMFNYLDHNHDQKLSIREFKSKLDKYKSDFDELKFQQENCFK